MKCFVSTIFLLLFFINAYAVVPQAINYQGYLATSGGTPVNSAVQIVFSVYNVETGGSKLWDETQTVQVNNGIYAVALGSINPIDPAIIEGDLWLGVKVGADSEMTPRQKLNSVPFAMKAQALAEGEQLEAICSLYDASFNFKPSFCPPIAGKKVFISSVKYNGNMGGIAGADANCQQLAIDSGLAGIYKAWLSDITSSPSVRFAKSSVPYLLLNGLPVAQNYNDLTDGQLQRNINIDNNGAYIFSGGGTSEQVYTNTTNNGMNDTSRGSCENWTSSIVSGGPESIPMATVYSGDAPSSSWTVSTSNAGGCLGNFRIYCFEQ